MADNNLMNLPDKIFFDELSDSRPEFYLDFNDTEKSKNTKPDLYFCGYDSPARFLKDFSVKSCSFVSELKNGKSFNEITDYYILNYLVRFKMCLKSFHCVTINNKTYHCHKEYSIQHNLIMPPVSIKLDNLETHHKKIFYEYNQNKYTVLTNLTGKLQEIIKLHPNVTRRLVSVNSVSQNQSNNKRFIIQQQ